MDEHGPSVSVLLSSHRRGHLRQQVQAILAQDYKISEFVVHHNAFPGTTLDSGFLRELGVHFVYCSMNSGVWTRFSLALEFTTDYVAVFDDDMVPGPNWISSCVNTAKHFEGCVLGGNGVRFPTGDRAPREYFGWGNPSHATIEADIAGHVWFFPRDLLNAFHSEERPEAASTGTCGEDYFLSYIAQKHGWPTYVPPHPEWCKEVWSNTAGMLGDDSVALFRTPGEEWKKKSVHDELVQRGWKTMFHRTAAPC